MSSFIQFLNLTEKCRHMDVKNDKKPISEDPPIYQPAPITDDPYSFMNPWFGSLKI